LQTADISLEMLFHNLDISTRKRLVIFCLVDLKVIRGTLVPVNKEVAERQVQEPDWGIDVGGNIQDGLERIELIIHVFDSNVEK
jgi:hypothetical protein